MQPVRIFKLNGADLLKGYSIQPTLGIRGIFRIAQNFNPFNKLGLLTPSKVATEITGISKTIRVIVPYVNSGSKFYCYADDSTLYSVSGTTATDVSAQLTSGSTTARGAGIFKNMFLYAKNTEIRGNVIPVSSGSDLQLLSGLNSCDHPFCVGADGYGYFGNGTDVARITSVAGTSGNSTTSAPTLETGFTVRKLINDGRYLVVIADNCSSPSVSIFGIARCIVGFWDMAKGHYDQLFEFKDSNITAAEIKGDWIHIFTPNNEYKTNSYTRPYMVWPFRGNVSINQNNVPVGPNALTLHHGFLLWGAQASSQLYGYGNEIPGGSDIMFQPFTASSTITAVGSDNVNVLAATGNTKLYHCTDSNAVSDTASITISDIYYDRPYKFAYARVVLNDTTAGAITLLINSQNGGKVITSDSWSVDAMNHIFHRKEAGSADAEYFEELNISLSTNGPAIQDFEIWGFPATQSLIIPT